MNGRFVLAANDLLSGFIPENENFIISTNNNMGGLTEQLIHLITETVIVKLSNTNQLTPICYYLLYLPNYVHQRQRALPNLYNPFNINTLNLLDYGLKAVQFNNYHLMGYLQIKNNPTLSGKRIVEVVLNTNAHFINNPLQDIANKYVCTKNLYLPCATHQLSIESQPLGLKNLKLYENTYPSHAILWQYNPRKRKIEEVDGGLNENINKYQRLS